MVKNIFIPKFEWNSQNFKKKKKKIVPKLLKMFTLYTLSIPINFYPIYVKECFSDNNFNIKKI